MQAARKRTVVQTPGSASSIHTAGVESGSNPIFDMCRTMVSMAIVRTAGLWMCSEHLAHRRWG
eukprot:2248225-Alexandrium_andersonii.AAC.1